MENESEFRSFHISDLLKKHKEGALTTVEEIELQHWLNESPQNEILFKELAGEYYITQQLNQFKRYDPEAAFNRISQRIGLSGPKQSIIRSLYFKIAVAAASVLLLFFAYSNKDRIVNWLNPVHYETAATLVGERKLLTLDDGTRIWLSPASFVSYPNAFRSSTREIRLKGEAFFEVAKDKLHPFIIHSGAIDTRVLGTTFNIQAYPENKTISVTLVTGKVNIITARHQSIALVPNQRAVFNKANDNLSKMNYPGAAQMLARKDGYFHYEGTPIIEIAQDMERQYHINIEVRGNISNCTFYGDKKPDDDVYKFLQKVSISINAQIKIYGSTIIITTPGC